MAYHTGNKKKKKKINKKPKQMKMGKRRRY